MAARVDRSRALRRWVAAHLSVLFLLGHAGAEPSAGDRALATALFQDGRTLMAEGRVAEACPKFEESHRLDPSGGTILNLALCHEQGGFLARAWSEFHEAVSFAHRDGRSDREQAAESHIRALEPRLSRLTIVVLPSVRVPGLRIERNGRELGQASWSTAMPVDGGEHIVNATAPGQKPFTTTIVIGNESDARTVEVPPFVALPAAPVTATTPQLVNATPARATAPLAPPNDAHDGGARRTVGWALGAASVVQLGLAGYFGVQAFRKHAESNSGCPNQHCTEAAVETNESAGRMADAATVLTVTGLATLATSVVLLVVTPNGSSVARSARSRPIYSVSGTASTIVVKARF